MKSLTLANQKGGVGKTTTLVHLAFAIMEQGRKVVVVDLDVQGNASSTLEAYSCGVAASTLFSGDLPELAPTEPGITLFPSDAPLVNLERFAAAEVAEYLEAALEHLEEAGFDVCLIDTGPSLNVILAAALSSTDFVLSPIEAESYSLDGIRKMVTTISNIKKANNPALTFLGMVPNRINGLSRWQKQNVKDLQEAYPTLVPKDLAIKQYSGIGEALAQGIPVWKLKKSQARKSGKEFKQLAAYVLKQMEV